MEIVEEVVEFEKVMEVERAGEGRQAAYEASIPMKAQMKMIDTHTLSG